MQEETEVLGEILRERVWIDNQIHIQPWSDWESNRAAVVKGEGTTTSPTRSLSVSLIL